MIMSVLAKCLLYSVLKLYGEAWFLSHLDITAKRAASYPKQRIYYHDYCWRVLYRPITQQDDSWRIAVITVISGLHTNEAKGSALLCIDLFVSLYAFSNKRIFDRRLNCNTRHCFAQSFTSRKDKLSTLFSVDHWFMARKQQLQCTCFLARARNCFPLVTTSRLENGKVFSKSVSQLNKVKCTTFLNWVSRCCI